MKVKSVVAALGAVCAEVARLDAAAARLDAVAGSAAAVAVALSSRLEIISEGGRVAPKEER